MTTAPLVLAITTSAATCAASVHGSGGERGGDHLDLGRGHAERVIEVCANAIDRAGGGWADLTHIAVDIGPGSFTGVRAGVAAARGLALSLGVPAIGVSTADAIAESEDAAPLAVAIDLRRGRVALATFSPDLAPIAAMAVEEAVEALASAAPRHLRGSGAMVVAEGLRARSVEPLSIADAVPTASGVARVALSRIAAGVGVGEAVDPPTPLYLRAADAVPAAASPFANPAAQGRPR